MKYPTDIIDRILRQLRSLTKEVATISSGGGSLPNGGTIGQVLTKQSSTDGDADWEDTAASTEGALDYGLTGAINGTNDTFQTSVSFSGTTIKVWRNGSLQYLGDDYITSGTDLIIFSTAPKTGELLIAEIGGATTGGSGGSANLTWNEQLTGLVNGTNKVFNTSAGISSTNINLVVGNIPLILGTDYTITDAGTGEITLSAGTSAPSGSEKVVAMIYEPI